LEANDDAFSFVAEDDAYFLEADDDTFAFVAENDTYFFTAKTSGG